MKEALAFRHEFYESAEDSQIREDLISYLGEYRFKVPEFNYRLGLKEGKIVDPNTGESMLYKAKKAVERRMQDGLNYSREEADFEGLLSLEKQLKVNSDRTIVWFSPQGREEEGYGDYGFAYVGKKIGNSLEMTAIRLEKPTLRDFNKASGALWEQIGYQKAEEFIKDPRVIDVPRNMVKEFIIGNFQIGDTKLVDVFRASLGKLHAVIGDYIKIVRTGTDVQKEKALNAVENLAIELKEKFPEFVRINLSQMMGMEKYITKPNQEAGSCGVSSASNNLVSFRSGLFESKLSSSNRSWEFNEEGPCRLCGADVPCGPCKICKNCNDEIDREEMQIAA